MNELWSTTFNTFSDHRVVEVLAAAVDVAAEDHRAALEDVLREYLAIFLPAFAASPCACPSTASCRFGCARRTVEPLARILYALDAAAGAGLLEEELDDALRLRTVNIGSDSVEIAAYVRRAGRRAPRDICDAVAALIALGRVDLLSPDRFASVLPVAA